MEEKAAARHFMETGKERKRSRSKLPLYSRGEKAQRWSSSTETKNVKRKNVVGIGSEDKKNPVQSNRRKTQPRRKKGLAWRPIAEEGKGASTS